MSDGEMDRLGETAQPTIESAREAAAGELARRVVGGGITLDEYTEHAVAVQHAATDDELKAALLGLPEATAVPSPARRSLVAVFGGTEQRGRWRLSRHLRIVAVFGGAKLDLGAAEVEAPESVITTITLFGGVNILAPPGVPIQLSGFSLLGGKSDKRAPSQPLPGAPLIRVRGISILGGVAIDERKPGRNVLDTIRGRRGNSMDT